MHDRNSSSVLLPALNLAYISQGINHTPRSVIVRRMLPEVDAALESLGVFDDVNTGEASEGSSAAKNYGEAEWRKGEWLFATRSAIQSSSCRPATPTSTKGPTIAPPAKLISQSRASMVLAS